MRKYLSILLIFFVLPIGLKAQEKSLDYFLNQAKQNSPLLKDFDNQVSILKLDSAKIKAGFMPQVSGASHLFYAPVIKGFGYDPVITNGQLFDALITVNKEINTRRRSNTYIQSIQLSKDSLSTQKALSQAALAQNISAQYINTLGDQELLNLSKEILNLLEKEDDLLKRLTQNSVFKQTDYLAFKVNLEQQKLVVTQNFNQFKTDLSTLQYLSGLSDTTTYSLKPLDYTIAEVPKFEESLTAKTYKIDSLKTINDLSLLRLNYQPRLSAFADAGYNTSFPTQAYKNFGISAGLSLNIPIYDGGQRKMTEQQIKLQQMSINNYKYYAQNQYQQQENQLKNIIKRYDDLIAQSQNQITYSKTLVDANALQLSSGDVRMTDYLLAIANYLQLRANIIQNKINQLQAINQLRYFTVK